MHDSGSFQRFNAFFPVGVHCRVHIEDGDEDRAFLGQTGEVLVVLNLWNILVERLSRIIIHIRAFQECQKAVEQ